ncbi:MAG: DUF4623 domain-containing protein [Bacteroidetes bacterium]|nr:MAG: DUF4623 domain-containing protein [Bacteroidota bacterium]
MLFTRTTQLLGRTSGLFLLALLLSLVLPARAQVMLDTPTWSIEAGSVGWLQTDNNVRGADINPATGNILVVSRTGGLSVIAVGSDGMVQETPLDATGISGGIFPLSEIAVTSDGQIFAANLVLDGTSSNVKIYRWANESSAPEVVFDGTVAEGTRYGDALGVSGSGTDVSVYLSGSGNDRIAVFNYTGTAPMAAPSFLSVAAGAARGGIAKAPGEEALWINGFGTETQKISLTDGTVLATIPSTTVPSGTMDLDAFEAGGMQYLVVGPDAAQQFHVVDVTNPAMASIVATTAPLGSNANANAAGAAVFNPTNGSLVALSTNNALASFALEAQAQIVHNSPYAAAATVDVYVNDGLAIDDFAFRAATGFLPLPAGVDLTVDVTGADAPDNSSPVFSTTLNLAPFTNYYVIAAGDPLGGAGQPAFGLVPYAMARQSAATTGNAEFLIFHGSPDAPTVDVTERTAGTLADDLAFGAFSSDYVSVPPGAYDVDIETADNSAVAASFVADLSGSADAALLVAASGFLSPSEGDPAFGLLAVFADGTTALLPANTALVQVIHNSPVGTVDVYVNDEEAIPDFEFRTATAFIELPAGTTPTTAPNLKIDLVADGASDNSSPAYTETVQVQFGKQYLLIATGDGVAQALDLVPYDMARTAAAQSTQADLLVFHGAPDAPTVDVVARGAGPVVDDLAYGAFASEGYLELPIAPLVLDITPADDNTTVVADYFVPLTDEEQGAAFVVVASGYLAPTGDQPGFALVAFPPQGGEALIVPPILEVSEARALPADAEDIAVSGLVTRAMGRISFIQDKTAAIGTFQSSGDYFDAIAAGDVAPGDEIVLFGSRSDFRNLTQLSPDNFLVLSRENALPEPQTVTLAEIAANGEDYEGELIRVQDLRIDADGDVVFGDNASYAITDPSDDTNTVELRITRTSDSMIPGRPIPVVPAIFTGVLGQFNTTYQLFPINEDDIVPGPYALAQIIHNAADPAAASVDVYVNGTRALDDFDFRSATPFIELPTDVTIDITAPDAADNSSPVFSKSLMLENGGTYVVVASGLVGTSFDLYAAAGRRMSESTETVDVLAFHGVTDAPTVDVTALGSPRPLVNDFAFGEFASEGYLSLPAADYVLNVTPGDDNDMVVASFEAPLATLELGGSGLVVLASGFLAPQGDAPAFALIAVTPDGSVTPLPANTTARAQIIHNAADPAAETVDIYLSQDGTPLATLDDVAFRTATGFVDLPAGDVLVEIKGPDSTPESPNVFTKTLMLKPGETYVVVASGVVGDSFDLFAAYGREQSSVAGQTDLGIFHGVSDAPAVDVVLPGETRLTLSDDLAFGAFEPYQSVPTADYPINVELADNSDIVAIFEAKLATLGLEDQALMVLASGFLSPPVPSKADGHLGFALVAATAAGGELVTIDVVSGVPNVPVAEVPAAFTLHGNYPNPFNPSTTIRFDLPAQAEVSVEVYDMLGRQVLRTAPQAFTAGANQRVQIDAASLASGLYLYRVVARTADDTLVRSGQMTLIK